MALATTDELQDWLGYELAPEEQARATLMVASATAMIQAYTRQTLEAVAADSVTLQGTWQQVLRLPERPVTSVTSVTVDGVLQTPSDDYVVVLNELRRPQSEYHNWQIPSTDFYPFTKTGWGGPSTEVVVVYDHGFSTIPDELRGVCLQVAARTYMNPEAVQSKVIDGHTFQYGSGHLDLTAGERAVLDRYRLRAMSASTY